MLANNGDLRLKKALDGAIYPSVKTYHGKLPNVGVMPKEFCIYTIGSMNGQDYADDALLGGSDRIVLRYYHAEGMKLSVVRQRERDILNALLAADFQCPTGSFELGDVDDIGYNVTGFEILLSSWR